VTTDHLELISADPRAMHGQTVIARTRMPVSVILDCLAADITTGEITVEYSTVTVAGVQAAPPVAAEPVPFVDRLTESLSPDL
jgi:uncharacterized protein (DUF433 family)